MNERDQYYNSNIADFDGRNSEIRPWVKKTDYILSNTETISNYNSYNDNSDNSDNSDYSDNSNSNSNSPEDNPYKLITRRIDRNRVNNRQRRHTIVNFTSADQMDMSDAYVIRAGVIVYTKFAGETLFCLGVDAQFGDLTDFGGGVKKSEDIITGGLRELEEESLGVFGEITRDQVLKVPTVWSNNLCIMFIPMKLDIDNTLETFHHKLSDKKNIEVKDIVWLSKEEFLESICGSGRRLYSRVRRVLKKAITDIAKL